MKQKREREREREIERVETVEDADASDPSLGLEQESDISPQLWRHSEPPRLCTA